MHHPIALAYPVKIDNGEPIFKTPDDVLSDFLERVNMNISEDDYYNNPSLQPSMYLPGKDPRGLPLGGDTNPSFLKLLGWEKRETYR